MRARKKRSDAKRKALFIEIIIVFKTVESKFQTEVIVPIRAMGLRT